MQLSKRLSAIADMVTDGNRIADVGCDHGYLPVYLVQQGRIPSAIAMDINEGPLKRAEAHIREYGLEAFIGTRRSDGLQALHPHEADTLVIAGMGGLLTERILREGSELLPYFREMILQPQSDVPVVRGFLLENGYRIPEEEMVLEEGKYYFILKAVPAEGKEDREPWSAEEMAYGKRLLEKKHPVLYRYLGREQRIFGEIEERLKQAPGEKAHLRMQELKEEQQILSAALKRYESI